VARYRIRPSRFIPAVAVLACLLALAGWGVWSALAWAKSAVLHHLLDVRFLAHDEITQTVPVQGLLIKQEELIKAPVPGKLHLLVRDGERLRVGAPLAEIQGITCKTLYSPRAGVFCTHLDGLENLLVPGALDVLDMGAVEKIKTRLPQPKTGAEVQSGQFIGKVVDNLQPLLLYVEMENAPEPAPPVGAAVRLLLEGRELVGRVKEVREFGGRRALLVETGDYPADLVHRRRVSMQLVTRRLAGWLVPEGAIVFQEGQPGIYVVVKQVVRWIPVAVTDRLEGKVSIEGGHLSSTVRYISNPRWVRDGTRLGDGG